MAFSGTVKLTDLNDFIAPSQACVVKTEGSKVSLTEATAGNGVGDVQLQQPRKGGFSQTKLLPSQSGASNVDAVKVTLNDCLACSGCVTSAETVLLEQHSSSELLAALQDSSKRVIVSLSPQSRASLAVRHGLSPLACFRKLRSVLRQMGVAAVLDTSCGRELSLLETSQELVHRLQLARRGAPDKRSFSPSGVVQHCIQVGEGRYSLSAQPQASHAGPQASAGEQDSWVPSIPGQDHPPLRQSLGLQHNPARVAAGGPPAGGTSPSHTASIGAALQRDSMASDAAESSASYGQQRMQPLHDRCSIQQGNGSHSGPSGDLPGPSPMAEASGQLPWQPLGSRQAKAARTGHESLNSSPAAAPDQDAASDTQLNHSSVSNGRARGLHIPSGPLVSSTIELAQPYGSKPPALQTSTHADASALRPESGSFTTSGHQQQQISAQTEYRLLQALESSYSNQQGSSSLVQESPQQSGGARQAGMAQQRDEAAKRPGGPLPLLVSSCPGWVVYAEKTHGSYILPYISTAKSPQGMMGSLVKRVLSRQLGVEPQDIFHCTIMPCYDRKLEAAREELRLPGSQVPETDCVLATLDLQQLLDERGVSLGDVPLRDDAPAGALDALAPAEGLTGVPGSAGGYLEHAFRTAAWELFRVRCPEQPLSMRRLRNDDLREVVLEAEGTPLLRFAAAYGFRNIQTLVRKIKRGACEYDFVEIMACPSACLNGGGQLRPAKGETAAELLAAVSASYQDPEVRLQWPEQDPAVPQLLADLQASWHKGDQQESILRMSYKDRGRSQLSGMSPLAAADW